MIRPRSWRTQAAAYLFIQGACVALWWLVVYLAPGIRAWFRGTAPDEALLAFGLGSMLLIAGAGAWAAFMLVANPRRALVPLALHTGAGAFAALYCLGMWRSTGAGGLAFFFMSPYLWVQPVLLNRLMVENP